MSGWVERELQRERDAKLQAARLREAMSRFWPMLLDRLGGDCEYFNERVGADRKLDVIYPSTEALLVGTPGGAISIRLEVDLAAGRIDCRRGNDAPAAALDLKLDLQGGIEYQGVIGEDAARKLAQDLLKPLMFPGR